ncbi:MAG TPA: MMPL family transporter [Candidatus Limnocylindria bacterium]|nr:MMPL family transporter [Candidatus Limnocylindria bacterium]
MAGGFEAAVDRACARWVRGVARRPRLTLALVGLVTATLGLFAVFHLGVNADPRGLVNRDLPFQVRQREFTETFQTLSDGILVVIDGDSPTAAARAADTLAARLARRTDVFAQVDVPGGGPFFARNALLYLTADQLDDFTDRLSKVQPLLAELARDQSLVGIADLLREALEAQRTGEATGLELATALDRVSVVIEAAARGERAPDPWGSAVLGGALPPEARQRVVALRPVYDSWVLRGDAPELRLIRAAAKSADLVPERGLRVRITGEPVMNFEEIRAVATQSWQVAIISVVLFAGTVSFALRSGRMVAALIGSLLVSLVWSNGIAALLVRDLNTISAAFNVLIVGLGGEFGIHFAMRYVELAGSGRRRLAALVETAESIGGSLVSSAGTTSIGFFIFVLTDFTGVAQLGVISGVGMFASLLSTLTVLPALIAVGAEPIVSLPPAPAWLGELDRFPIRHARTIRIAAAVAGVAACLLVPRIRFNYNLASLHDPTTESVSTFDELLARADTAPWAIDVVAPDLEQATVLAARLAELPTVAETRTLRDYVPAAQVHKLEILETAAYFVPPTLTPGPPRTDAERRAALRALAEEAGRAAEDGPLAASAARLQRAIGSLLDRSRLPAGTLAELERTIVGSLPEQIRDLQRLVAPETVTLESLPATLKARMLAPDGRARIQVLPAEDVSDSEALERFVASVQAVVPDAVGLAVYVVEWGRVTWRAMLWALVGGVACMLVFLVVLWRSAWDAMLAFFPLFLAAALTCASLVVLGQSFNFANVIVLPMLIGMSVDSGVHLVHRHRVDDRTPVLGTSTGRAVFYSALTTFLAFGSLGFAPHRGMAAIGQLLAIGVALVLVCYVVVLPAVLEWDDRRRRPGSATESKVA